MLNQIFKSSAHPLRNGAVILAAGLAIAACTNSSMRSGQSASRPVFPAEAVVAAPSESTTPASPQIIWALRSGLNVAALMCPEVSLKDDYNQMLKAHRSLLAQTHDLEQARYRQLYGREAEARQSAAMTRLYQSFANVIDRKIFCSQASGFANRAVSISSETLARQAQQALASLQPGAVELATNLD